MDSYPILHLRNDMNHKLSIIVPAYNEEKTISNILDKILAVQLIGGVSKEIVVVNDASSDQTEQVVEAYMKAKSDAPMTSRKLCQNRRFVSPSSTRRNAQLKPVGIGF